MLLRRVLIGFHCDSGMNLKRGHILLRRCLQVPSSFSILPRFARITLSFHNTNFVKNFRDRGGGLSKEIRDLSEKFRQALMQ